MSGAARRARTLDAALRLARHGERRAAAEHAAARREAETAAAAARHAEALRTVGLHGGPPALPGVAAWLRVTRRQAVTARDEEVALGLIAAARREALVAVLGNRLALAAAAKEARRTMARAREIASAHALADRAVLGSAPR